MLPSLEKLSKFLVLEIERNYDNRSVIGGLENICQTWKQEALIQGASFDLVNLICETLSTYSLMDYGKRNNSIKIILEKLIYTNVIVKKIRYKDTIFFNNSLELILLFL